MISSPMNEELTDSGWFGQPENAGRTYRVRSFRRADAPGMHPEANFPRGYQPVATVVAMGRFGPFVAALPAFFGAPVPSIENTDAGAIILIEAGRAARARHYGKF